MKRIVDEEVVGYIDVTYKHDKNELFDIFVKEEYWRRGYRKVMHTRGIQGLFGLSMKGLYKG